MRDILIFFAGSTVGSLVTTAAIAMCMAAKRGDQQLDGQHKWREEVRSLLGE